MKENMSALKIRTPIIIAPATNTPRLAPVPASSSSQPTLQDLTRVTTLPPITAPEFLSEQMCQKMPKHQPNLSRDQAPSVRLNELNEILSSGSHPTLSTLSDLEYTHTPYAKILPRLRLHPLVSIDAVASPSPSVTRPSSSTSTRPSRPSSPL
ncbi:hypothetical protein BLNAU_21176 [Blattamonas nauphoetae]|uniref:Uncharacterized protein n=1 Tax=Blattamonas nauphoetae TaxID=2049346 RepID=A0ABQ9WWN9_9EUKA|nr:hypothetical protein BLNAU_21176 [Blattamonas nauphoetae]